MAESGKKRKDDIDEVHECLKKTVYAVKQVGINCMRQKSSTEEDINASKNVLAADRKKFEREKAEFEAERDDYDRAVLADLTSRVPIMKNTWNMQYSQTTSKEINVNVAEINPTNAMFGDGNTQQINITGVQSKDVDDIKNKLSEMMTEVQDGNIGNDKICEMIPKLKEDIALLLKKVNSLESEITRSNKELQDQLVTFQQQYAYLKTLKRKNQQLKRELNAEKERKKTIQTEETKESSETSMEEWPKEELMIEPTPITNRTVEMWVEHSKKLEHFVEKSIHESKSMEDKLNSTRQLLHNARAWYISHMEECEGTPEEPLNDMAIVDLIKQEHTSLANEFDERVTETNLKETYLHLKLEESNENEAFLKQQNKNIQNEMKKVKQKLIQSNADCEEVKENLTIIHDKLQMEQKASFSARNELSHIVSCLHRYTDFPHVQHGIKGQTQTMHFGGEQVKNHLEEFTGKQKMEMTYLEKKNEEQEEFIESQKERINGFKQNMANLKKSIETTRTALNESRLENHTLRESLQSQIFENKSLHGELKQTKVEIHDLNNRLLHNEHQIEKLKSMLHQSREELKRTAFNESRLENHTLKESLQNQIFENKSLHGELKQTKVEIHDLNNRLLHNEHQIEKLQTMLHQSQEELKSQQEKFKQHVRGNERQIRNEQIERQKQQPKVLTRTEDLTESPVQEEKSFKENLSYFKRRDNSENQ